MLRYLRLIQAPLPLWKLGLNLTVAYLTTTHSDVDHAATQAREATLTEPDPRPRLTC